MFCDQNIKNMLICLFFTKFKFSKPFNRLCQKTITKQK
jgi:hypothetical protein